MALFSRSSRDSEGRWLIVGLGNPGDKYERTRHNSGALVLEELLRRCGASLKSHRSGNLVAEVALAGERAVLARPNSYMNESGRPVRALLSWYKTSPSRLVVIHDELDLPLGGVRVKWGGGTAGHNGLKSIVSHLGTQGFVRVRVGISRPGAKETVDYVLSNFSSAERRELPFVLGDAADAVERIVAAGVERAMNEVNTRSR
ncbi:MAG TPA: aminoacyl-tRNA hydrolase [Actinomycetota bacterium]|nr:aminoacyl-tRNA hydrolase [Actinomycetota bacterium]